MIYILTAKLRDKIINCYDGKLDKETLKKWTAKNIIMCPVCNKPYEYCHGEFKNPYFRHKEKNSCENKYNESETQEHLQGKQDLYEWVKSQDGVTDAVLEGWIPETKQRPDIMFKIGDTQYVIEYQCTPIATEYHERHKLYKESGIVDIWILGYEKYRKYYTSRDKVIERFATGYYETESKQFYVYFKNVNEARQFGIPYSKRILKFNNIVLTHSKSYVEMLQVSIQNLINICNIYQELNFRRSLEKEEQPKREQFVLSKYIDVEHSLNDAKFLNLKYKFSFYPKVTHYYLSKFFCEVDGIGFFAIFIKNRSFDICNYTYEYKTLKSVDFDIYDIKYFENEVKSFFLYYVNNKKLED